MKKLSTRLTAAFLLLALAPLALMGVLLGLRAYQGQLASAHQYMQTRADNAALRVSGFFKDIEGDLESLAWFRDIQALDREVLGLDFLELLAARPMLRELALTDARGEVRARESRVEALAPDRQDWSGLSAVSQALATGRMACGYLDRDPHTGEMLMDMAKPLQDLRTGQVNAVLVTRVQLKDLADQILKLSRKSEVIYLATQAGDIVAHPNVSLALAEQDNLPETGPRLTEGSLGLLVVAAASRVEVGGQVLLAVAEQERGAALGKLTRDFQVYALIFLLAWGVALGLAVLARRTILGPVARLADTARAIQAGNLEERAQPGPFVETGELARAFNSMTGRLLASLEDLRREMAERVRAEEGQRASQERLDLALEAVSDGLWDWDVATGVTFFSDRYLGMLGYRPDELAQSFNTWRSLLHPEDLDRCLSGVREALDGQGTLDMEFRLRTRDGGWKWILSRGAVVARDQEGRPARMVGTHIDIDERKRVQEALHEALSFNRAILEYSPVGIGVYDAVGGDCVQANAALADLTGVPLDAVRVQNFRRLDSWRDSGLLGQAEKALDSGEFRRADMELKTPSGGRAMLECLLAGFTARDRRYLLLMASDISARKASERALKAAMVQADSASRAKSEFLATMSHEIRTPLNGLMSMLQLAQDADPSPELKDYLDLALFSSRSLLRLLSDILDISRVEAGTLGLAEESFRLAEVLDPVMLAFRDEAGRRGIDLGLEVLPGIPETLTGDPSRIRQILLNLVGNALKYTAQGSVRLEVSPLPVSPRPGGVSLHFCVADTGIGIPDDKLERIFEVFTQLERDPARVQGGAGLGLSIVKRLVRLMKGNMAVVSEPGQGTEVHLSLPLGVGRAEASGPGPARPAPGGNPAARILVVEDERINQFAISRMLQKMGHDLVLAANGREALDLLGREAFDAVLMDVRMPVMDGVEATRRIRAGEGGADPSVPIVALTAHAMSGDRERLLAAGMDAYLAKPLESRDLAEVLARVLAGRRARPEAGAAGPGDSRDRRG